MKNRIFAITVILTTLLITRETKLSASTTATALITYSIGSIDAITVSGNPGPLNVSAATAGSGASSTFDSSTTYAVTTNNTNRMVTGALASDMPTGVTLSVDLQAATGAISAGEVNLTTTPIGLVNSLSNVSQGGLLITYTLTATVEASLITDGTNTVTFTIFAGG